MLAALAGRIYDHAPQQNAAPLGGHTQTFSPMKLPQAENAIVDDAKVRDYLLSAEHPVGRFKARVFIAAGYRRKESDVLRKDLLAAASVIDVAMTRSDAFGRRFAGTADLRTPNGNLLPVVTVWIISSEGAPPRLLTAYPAEDL